MAKTIIGLRRRTVLMGSAALALPFSAIAQTRDVHIGVVDSLSGPWAYNGGAGLEGAKMAVEQINSAGGIKSLGGAMLKLDAVDAGKSPDEARSAAQRLIANEPNLVGGMGAFVSSLALAISEVTERAKIPWLVLASADQITDRGFHYIFATNMASSKQASQVLPQLEELGRLATGAPLKTIAIVSENTPSVLAFAEGIRKGMAEKKIAIPVDEVYSIPLPDGAVVAQRVRRGRPDMILLLSTNPQDTKTLLSGLKQAGITPSSVPIFVYGAGAFVPEMLNLTDKQSLQGLTGLAANWTTTTSTDLANQWTSRTKQGWITMEPKYGYGHVWLLKEALEKAGAPDREAVAVALRTISIDSGPVSEALQGHVSFGPDGRREAPPLLLMQWQNGMPVTVYPENLALAKPLHTAS